MKNFVNCYSNGNITVLGIALGDKFQHVMEVASLYNGKTDMIQVIIPEYKVNENLYVSVLFKFDNNRCIDITIESCNDKTSNVWDAANIMMGMLDPNLFVINNSSSSHDTIRYGYLNPLLSISIYTHFNTDFHKLTAVMHITSRYWECFRNKLNSESVMNKIFQLYKAERHSGHHWLTYYYFILSLFVTAVVLYCCHVLVENSNGKTNEYNRYSLHEKFVVDKKTGKVYYISTSYPPKKVFDPSLLK